MKYNPSQLKLLLDKELTHNILPFWMEKMKDTESGGFYGQMVGNGQLVADAPRGGILNARILWTFSAAYRSFKNPAYLANAKHAKEYIFSHFFDSKSGGAYWSLTFNGVQLDTKKQIYAQAFFIYALSEYFLATGDIECKEKAIELFHLIEKYSFDPVRNGYFEAFSHNWQLLDDLRLSDKDANEKKTMNTHLHILEAYTNLHRIWKNDTLANQLHNLINVFLDKIIDPVTSHLKLFFNQEWECKSSIISYGHDIESSWLLYEAAVELGDDKLIGKAKEACVKIAKASEEGIQPDGSIIYEKNITSGHSDYDRHWWPQAEAVVGFYNAFELTGEMKYFSMASECYHFIELNLIDKVCGEWYWSMKSDGKANLIDDKAGFWKCPYHNGRMCLEIIRRVSEANSK